MPLNERIKKLRKALDLTQQEFADRIGSVQNTITGYETGRRMPSKQVITLICREFNVNETWLRTGEGDMLLPRSREDEIAAFMDDVLRGDKDFRRRFISILARMTREEWGILEKKILELAGEAQENEARIKAEARKDAAAYYNGLLSEREPDTPVSSVKESGAV